jgi:hypothetical protein
MLTKTSTLLTAVELNRFVDLREAARLRGCSEATLRRHFSHQIVEVSPGRKAMRIKHALMVDGEAQ